jgi:hypothetical protein
MAMTKLYTYLALAGIIGVGLPAMATGLPTYGFAEIVTMKVDSIKNVATQDLLQTHKNMVRDTLKGLKGAYGEESEAPAEGEESGEGEEGEEDDGELLSSGSSAVTGRNEGLQTLLGEGGSLMTCGDKGRESLIELLNKTVVFPGKEEDRKELTTAEDDERQNRLDTAKEMAATTALAKAWLAQAEAANVSETLTKFQTQLGAASSQMEILAIILRLQEETQKNINTRLSVMGDELVSAGLSALDTGI